MNGTRLLIIRHGNTFDPGETPRRIGCRTDLPLSASGVAQARALGDYVRREGMVPDYICTSALERARQTARLMMHGTADESLCETDVRDCFNEIDHGPDEDKTEADIIERIGRDALDDWNAYGVVPDGWIVDPRAIQRSWVDFADECLAKRPGRLSCVVSSGGIIRFAAILLPGNHVPDGQTMKVATASLSMLHHDGKRWHCAFWNRRPA